MEGTTLFDHDAVVEIFYGNHWHEVKKGTYQEISMPEGRDDLVSYVDKYMDEATVIIHSMLVLGWKYLRAEAKVIEMQQTPKSL